MMGVRHGHPSVVLFNLISPHLGKGVEPSPSALAGMSSMLHSLHNISLSKRLVCGYSCNVDVIENIISMTIYKPGLIFSDFVYLDIT